MAEPSTTSTSTSKSLRRGLACALAFAGVFGLDALLFRTSIYPSALEPDSSTGQFELILRREQQAQARYGNNLVLTIGNSRFAWSAKLLDNLAQKPAYILRNAGLAGTDPRAWYYMLRDLDPTARRYRAIVIGVDDYDDEDRGPRPEDDIRNLHYAIARLRLSDVIEFPGSFHSPAVRWEALRGSLLKGTVFQTDFLAFLAHPGPRLALVRVYRQHAEDWIYNYVESSRSMAGLKIDWATLAVTFPPDTDQNQRDTVNSFLAHQPDEQTGRLYAFHRTWYGRIIDRYRSSPTKIIFLRLARGPVPRPDNLVRKPLSSIREFASRPNVVLAGEHAFDSLEHPEFYRDGMHLNRAGVEAFSVMLADEISRILGPAEQTPEPM
jgi:hypothetical protein